MGALGQIAISITAVLIAGERPSPRGDCNSRSAASGMATQVASNTRMSKAGLRFISPNCRLGRLRPGGAKGPGDRNIFRTRISKIKESDLVPKTVREKSFTAKTVELKGILYYYIIILLYYYIII